MNHGMIQMPQSYGKESYTECIVTFKGVQSGVIILNHQRQNGSNGPCLLDRVINNTIHEGPCPEQRIYFEAMTKITLVKSQEVQPNFVIYFKGMYKDFLAYFLVKSCHKFTTFMTKFMLKTIASKMKC